MANDYNGIAKFYDALSRIVYQRSIVKAQVYLIQFICDNDRVLLVGGGTGWILEEISRLNKKNISIVYLEKSSAMIEMAKKKDYKNILVEFVNAAVEEYNSTENFDIIITPFLFDNFLREKIQFVFIKLSTLLKRNGIWLYADFVNSPDNKLWQKFLLTSMYLFFRATAKIETQELVDMEPFFKQGYQLLSKQLYYKKFIQAIAYRKVTG